jgi:hypothetical protein
MNAYIIPFNFIKERASLSWRDISWGYEHQLLSWSSPIEFAVHRVAAGSNDRVEIELAGLEKSEAHKVGDLVRQLATGESPDSEEAIRRKWLFLVLAWLYEHKEQLDDPLGEVETIYANFDYPADIAGFVRYMPVTGEYDPRRHTKAENEKRLFDLWKEYLEEAAAKLKRDDWR